jgi:hypothetical protein
MHDIGQVIVSFTEAGIALRHSVDLGEDVVAGQTDRRMCLTRLPNSLALSDKLRS